MDGDSVDLTADSDEEGFAPRPADHAPTRSPHRLGPPGELPAETLSDGEWAPPSDSDGESEDAPTAAAAPDDLVVSIDCEDWRCSAEARGSAMEPSAPQQPSSSPTDLCTPPSQDEDLPPPLALDLPSPPLPTAFAPSVPSPLPLGLELVPSPGPTPARPPAGGASTRAAMPDAESPIVLDLVTPPDPKRRRTLEQGIDTPCADGKDLSAETCREAFSDEGSSQARGGDPFVSSLLPPQSVPSPLPSPCLSPPPSPSPLSTPPSSPSPPPLSFPSESLPENDATFGDAFVPQNAEEATGPSPLLTGGPLVNGVDEPLLDPSPAQTDVRDAFGHAERRLSALSPPSLSERCADLYARSAPSSQRSDPLSQTSAPPSRPPSFSQTSALPPRPPSLSLTRKASLSLPRPSVAHRRALAAVAKRERELTSAARALGRVRVLVDPSAMATELGLAVGASLRAQETSGGGDASLPADRIRPLPAHARWSVLATGLEPHGFRGVRWKVLCARRGVDGAGLPTLEERERDARHLLVLLDGPEAVDLLLDGYRNDAGDPRPERTGQRSTDRATIPLGAIPTATSAPLATLLEAARRVDARARVHVVAVGLEREIARRAKVRTQAAVGASGRAASDPGRAALLDGPDPLLALRAARALPVLAPAVSLRCARDVSEAAAYVLSLTRAIAKQVQRSAKERSRTDSLEGLVTQAASGSAPSTQAASGSAPSTHTASATAPHPSSAPPPASASLLAARAMTLQRSPAVKAVLASAPLHAPGELALFHALCAIPSVPPQCAHAVSVRFSSVSALAREARRAKERPLPVLSRTQARALARLPPALQHLQGFCAELAALRRTGDARGACVGEAAAIAIAIAIAGEDPDAPLGRAQG